MNEHPIVIAGLCCDRAEVDQNGRIVDALPCSVMEAFSAFDFGSGARSLHIVGEAYSDYQGFIEGALNSAELALRTIAAPALAEEGAEASGLS